MTISNLTQLNKEQLLATAREFAVDVDPNSTKAQILDALKEMGVTTAMYNALLEPKEEPVQVTEPERETQEEEDEAAEEPENLIVLKMTRRNATYEVRGYRFTAQNPYALVSEEDADYLIEHGGGFRQASPKELKEFYNL